MLNLLCRQKPGPMDFIYFQGPVSDMGDLLEGEHKCSICHQYHKYCFDIGYALTDKFSPEEKEGRKGRYECLCPQYGEPAKTCREFAY